MKKVSAIIAMATIMTIGGVYATFNYAQGDAASVSDTLSPSIESAVLESNKGKIEINSNFTVTIDDLGVINGGTTHSYFTGMKTTGTFKVTFTPEIGADADVRDNGIKLSMKLSFTGNKYDNKDIFVTTGLDSDSSVLLNEGKKVNGEYVVSLTDYFNANNEIKLSTYAEYQTYKAELDKTQITIEISEAK